MLLNRSIQRQCLPKRTFFTGFRKTYETGDGIKSIFDVFGPKKPERVEDYTITGKRIGDPFHYSDRKSGKGYTDFRDNPFPQRPYVYPPLKKDYRNFFWIIFLTSSIFFVDYRWIGFQIKKEIAKFYPGIEDWYQDLMRQMDLGEERDD
ncbi:unnamed protein product [Bursaphelenchus okinawaensis]|uniref:Uncharacterized protein n=1 Tax=Bursaphelenchus okinawaensis TaxID=465554 RepID=A0A811K1X5_9BILA|nr:unnamed protein product [Bursaphelenchus okinawaensis]CAG9090098.1 unnamed protein product [Bursaphelenchus okinawaensis]